MGFDTLGKFNVFFIRLEGTRLATCLVIERKGVPTRWVARALSDYKTVVLTGKLLYLNLKVASVISGLKCVLVRWNSTEEKTSVFARGWRAFWPLPPPSGPLPAVTRRRFRPGWRPPKSTITLSPCDLWRRARRTLPPHNHPAFPSSPPSSRPISGYAALSRSVRCSFCLLLALRFLISCLWERSFVPKRKAPITRPRPPRMMRQRTSFLGLPSLSRKHPTISFFFFFLFENWRCEFDGQVSKFRFLFPALGGLLFGYDIGATSGASISLQVSELPILWSLIEIDRKKKENFGIILWLIILA